MIVPVISVDLEKGHFTTLAKFIARHWPFGPALKLAEGQALLAKCLGYRDLHDVQQTAKRHSNATPFPLTEAQSLAASVLTQSYSIGEAEASGFVLTWNFDGFGFVHSVDEFTVTADDYEKIRRSYLDSWRKDTLLPQYRGLAANNSWPHSVKTLIYLVADAAKSSGDWLDGSKPILEWFRDGIRHGDGKFETIGQMAYRMFAKQTAVSAIWQSLSVQPHQWIGGNEDETSKKHNERLSNFLKGQEAQKLTDSLWGEAQVYLSTMTLAAPFREQKRENKFYYPNFKFLAKGPDLWHKNVRIMEISHHLGTVIFGIARPTELDEEAKLVLDGYIWNCQLKSVDGELLAYAAGTLYAKKPRSMWFPNSQATFWMADAIGEDEIVLMHTAFSDREYPAEKIPHRDIFAEIFIDCDIATVSRWERSTGAPKGAGRECLREALKIIKKKHKRTGYLIIDGRPLQFSDWSPHEEVRQIAVAKDDAKLRLEQYIALCELEDCLGRAGEVQVTFPFLNDIPDIDLKLLGKYQVESFEPLTDDWVQNR